MLRLTTCLLLFLAIPASAQEKIPILFDCDLGSDVDDAFALALIVASPELELRGVTTVSGNTQDRALMACRFLTHTGHRDIPVSAGADPQPKQDLNGQYQYRYHPAVIFNRTSKPAKESASEFLFQQLKADPGKLTICAVGPLTNIARLLAEHPECKPWIKRIVIMGGSVRRGYRENSPPEVEWNIKLDPAAAKVVFSSGVPLVMAPLDATAMLKVPEVLLRKLFLPCSQLTLNLQALYQMWNAPTPTLYDPVAVSLCISEKFCTMADLRIDVDDKGMTREVPGMPNARVAVGIQKDEYLNWYVDRVAKAMPESLPRAPGNPSKTIPRGKMPNRVHAFEDFETDIEKRWWLAGKLETKIVSPESNRALRGILTQDFDDRQGEMKTMVNGVVFNPVPGPIMGQNPRLSFRYWLKGTSTLRVQIYSLSNGYHRYLSLADLPQGRWESATVDMTQARRPNGTGGPLSDGERIDDIQFYVDPRAELLIDDIVLYDEALPTETKPFPKRILYSGLFDSGKQGKEWPGKFEIVAKNPPEKGKAAKSLPVSTTILLDLKGPRPLGEKTGLLFRHHLTGSDQIRVVLNVPKSNAGFGVESKVKANPWDQHSLVWDTNHAGFATEVLFTTTQNAELQLDDVLLYEPGRE